MHDLVSLGLDRFLMAQNSSTLFSSLAPTSHSGGGGGHFEVKRRVSQWPENVG